MEKIPILVWAAFLVCFLSTTFSFSQSDIIHYARQIIDTLAAPGMHGRGYVNKGDSIAADYIKKEFEKFGVKPFKKDFYQYYSFSVNSFPREMQIKSRKKELIPGKDFIMNENSGGGKGKFRTKIINTSPDAYKGGTQVFLDSMAIVHNPKDVLIIPNTKLISHLSQVHSPIIIIQIRDSLMNRIGKKININVDSGFIPKHTSKNIIGWIKGTQHPDSFIVFSSHYDHLGQMGKDIYFPGANDNASGCAMLLNLAKYYSEHPPKYSIAFMSFGAEEIGLLGSKYYVEHPLFPLEKIKFLVNMDIMGTGDEGIKVVNGTVHNQEFEQLVKINEKKNLLSNIQPRGKAMNSDHHFFEEAGVKTFFIYTLGGIKAYHDIHDRPETLPLTKFEDIFKLLTEFSEGLQR